MDRLSQAKYYTKIDLRVGYNNIRIAEGEEWKLLLEHAMVHMNT